MNLIDLLISALLSAIMPVLTVKQLSGEKITLKTFLRFFIVLCPLGIINYLCFTGICRLILTIIIIALSLYNSIFRKDIVRSVYYSITYEIIAFLVELLFSIIILLIGMDSNSYEQMEFSMLISTIFNVSIVYLISRLKFIQKSTKKFCNNISKNNADWIYIIIIILLMVFLMTFNWYNVSKNISYYINVGMVLFTFIMLIYFVFNNFQKNSLERKYNETMEYVSKYEKIINEQGKKNHEYNNQLMVIKGYLDNPKKLKEYLDLIIKDHKCGQNYTIKQLGYFPDGGIKGLIYHKLSKMEDYGIKPYLYIDSNIKDIFETKFDVNTYQDITKLLGVFLDNAIDASKDSDVKEIEFEVKKDDNCLIITISNSYNLNNDISQVGKKGYSTKGKGHGFGLSIVKDISKNNQNIETFTSNENEKFKQTIIIYYK